MLLIFPNEHGSMKSAKSVNDIMAIEILSLGMRKINSNRILDMLDTIFIWQLYPSLKLMLPATKPLPSK